MGKANTAVRIPLAQPISTRKTETDSGRRFRNCYPEFIGRGEEARLIKRPGIANDTTLNGNPNGLWNFRDNLIHGLDGDAFNGATSLLSFDNTSKYFSFAEMRTDSDHKLIVYNTEQLFFTDYTLAAGNVTEVTNGLLADFSWSFGQGTSATVGAKGVAYNGTDKFLTGADPVGGGAAKVYSSLSGTSWSEVSTSGLGSLNGPTNIAYNSDDNSWCLVGAGSGPSGWAAVSNDDGATWTAHTFSNAAACYSVAYGNGTWVVVGQENSTESGYSTVGTFIAYSTDNGASWVEAIDDEDNNRLFDVHWNGTYFVAVGDGLNGRDVNINGSLSSAETRYSTDGQSWSKGTGPDEVFLYGVGYGDSAWIAVGGAMISVQVPAPADTDPLKIYKSTDNGATWSEVYTTNDPGRTGLNSSVEYTNNKFYISGGTRGNISGDIEEPEILESADTGVTWTPVSYDWNWGSSPGDGTARYSTTFGNDILWLGGIDNQDGFAYFLGQQNAGSTQNFSTIFSDSGLFEPDLVPGIPELDGYVFVMDTAGRIYNSALEDPSSWDVNNVIAAENEADGGVYLAKYRNYVVAFGEYTTEFFYDAANATGSPLARVQELALKFGCAAPWSVHQDEDMLIWVGRTRHEGPRVYVMSGNSVSVISDQPTERILEAEGSSISNAVGYVLHSNGHKFYVLHLTSRTVVYDLTSNLWTEWGYGESSNFKGLFYANVNGTHYLQDDTNGSLYTLSTSTHTDLTNDMYVDIITTVWDGGVNREKYAPRIELICDRIDKGDKVEVRYSDDDYNSWSDWREVSLSKRPALYRTGRFARRAFHIRYKGSNPWRIDGIELFLSPGSYAKSGNIYHG